MEIILGVSGRVVCADVVRRFFRAKAQRFGANSGEAYGYRYPLGGVVAATFVVLGLTVKTLDHSGLDVGGGVVVEPRLSSSS